MSAAAAEQVVAMPEIRPRSWATSIIVMIDVLALQAALFFGYLARLSLKALFPISLGGTQYGALAIGTLTLPLAYYCLGLYPGYGIGAVQRLRVRSYSTLFVFGALLIWRYIFEGPQWSRGVLLGTALFALLIPPAVEALVRKNLIRRGICGEPVIILGAGRTGALLVRTLQRESDLGFVPMGILDDDPRKWGTSVHGVRVIGPLSYVRIFEKQAKAVLIAMPGMKRERLTELVQNLSFPNILIIPDLFGIQSLWIKSRDLGGVLGIEVRKNLLIPSNRLIKRILDCAIALPAIVAAAPFLAICAACIKLISPGPLFFCQEREGRNGRRIKIYKLRTMFPDAEGLLAKHFEAHPQEKLRWQQYYKLKADPRVLPGIGSFLRRYSLDELPQLWNVLRGEMSLVGPRPFPYYHLDSFAENFRKLRASITPGITGFWQVSERSDANLSMQEVEDTYYIRNWSIWLDIYILLRTIQRVIVPKGAY